MLHNIVAALRVGKHVCFPTETVFALASITSKKIYLQKLCAIKQRKISKFFSIMLHDTKEIEKFAEISILAHTIIEKFMPGPITIILPLKKNILQKYNFQSTIGIRIPQHPIALKILSLLKCPIVATSINISGKKNITKFQNIPNTIKKSVEHIFNDNKFVTGIESTIIKLTNNNPILIRDGAINFDIIQHHVSLHNAKNLDK